MRPAQRVVNGLVMKNLFFAAQGLHRPLASQLGASLICSLRGERKMGSEQIFVIVVESPE
jgi:hypothetical protein